MAELLPNKYGSPRVSGEFLDCSMPVTFDQYSNCSFGCVYCFATFQRGIGSAAVDYWKREVIKGANMAKMKEMIAGEGKTGFAKFFKSRKVFQWGGMSDPMCKFEEQFGIGLLLMDWLKETEYPYRISSKSDLPLRDSRYLAALTNKNLFYMASIITYDEKAAAEIEAGVPSPESRLATLEALSKAGVTTCLRLRPYIIGISDRGLETLIRRASECGVKHLSTEFFCLEMRSAGKLKERFDILSKHAGFDIVKFYRRLSNGSGYLRLNYRVKETHIREMQRLCEKYGLAFNCSDAHHKEKSESPSCCGLPMDNPHLSNVQLCQFTNALLIAKKNGEVHWGDIAKYGEDLKHFKYTDAIGLNTGSKVAQARLRGRTLLEVMHNVWNSPNVGQSPYKYFGGILKPDRLDKNGDVVYKYDELPEQAPPCQNCKSKTCHR